MTMEYKGYEAGSISFDPDTATFSGTIVRLNDVVYFEGTTTEELKAWFRAPVDDYLALCAERGEKP
jgi:predicted HicB family RNase H-like nuclease